MNAGTQNLTNKFTPPPYTYIHNIDLRNGDWTKPVNVVICEIRTKTGGTIKFTTRQNKTGKGFYDDYDIDRIDILTIHRDTTSDTLRYNQITVRGHYLRDLTGL